MTPETIRNHWIAGTNCACQRFDVREVMHVNATHIVLKHRSHSEHVNRATGTRNCASFAQLWERDVLVKTFKSPHPDDAYRRLKPLKEWTGRINPRQVQIDSAGLGILFE